MQLNLAAQVAYVKISPYIADCNNPEYTESATIFSPNYPNTYPHGISCNQSLKSHDGSTLILKMQYFDLESSKNCTKDSLKIFEGSELMSKRCGNDTSRYVSRSSPVNLKFFSDLAIARTGYRIQFTSNILMDFYQLEDLYWFTNFNLNKN